jgi:hypothetical protein
MAALLPALRIAACEVTSLTDDVRQVELKIDNVGYLGTTGLPSARALDLCEPVAATASAHGNAQLLAGTPAHQVLRHLDGWGRGVHSGQGLPAHPWTRGSTASVTATWLVRGHGELRLRVGCARTGFIEHTVAL